jgi:anti-sigma regulatory factor (Ser/Thr protein kinase)
VDGGLSVRRTRAGAGAAVTASTEVLLRLWPVPSACGDARRAVRELCRSGSLAHMADDAELLTSELVTNAARHAPTTSLITMLAVQEGDALVVTVTDDDEMCDDLGAALPDTLAESGRGMFVVDQIAGDWGTTRHVGGKTVWFRLP